MNDLDQELKDFFRAREAQVGNPPPLPTELFATQPASGNQSGWRRWVWVPVTIAVTSAIVVAVAVIDRDAPASPHAVTDTTTWLNDVCLGDRSEPSPNLQEVTGLDVVGAGICQWGTLSDVQHHDASTITATAALTQQQTEQLLSLLGTARPTPSCSIPTNVGDPAYFVMLREAGGNTWRVAVPFRECLSFLLGTELYSAPGLVAWLGDTMRQSAIETLTGRPLGEALGLQPIPYREVRGECYGFAEFDQQLGFCLDDVVSNDKGIALLGRQINGEMTSATERTYLQLSFDLHELMHSEIADPTEIDRLKVQLRQLEEGVDP